MGLLDGFFNVSSNANDASDKAGHVWDNTVGNQGLGGMLGGLFGKRPNLKNPTTGEPTLEQANTTMIQNQLAKEKMATSSVLTGGQGLLDEPTTTSALLVGT